jgi:acetyl-CoA C-acetyltransferase
MQKDPIVIVAAKRTPMGAMQGVFNHISATDLGAASIKGVLAQAKLDAALVDAVIMGNVLPAGLGQAPARQATLAAGLPHKTACSTVNKVCGSALEAIIMAHDFILTDRYQIVVAGGMENMSRAPYLLLKARSGYRLGNSELYDHMIFDGLQDPAEKKHMGEYADATASKYKFTREQQDEFAILSLNRAQEAVKAGKFKDEIVAVGEVSEDEVPMRLKAEKIPTLKPAFTKDGTVTAANSSSIADGAASVLLMRESMAKKHKLKPMARIIGHSVFAQEPAWFTTAPAKAIAFLLDKLSWKVEDVDLFEVNEAFACVTMATMHDLNIPPEKMNIHGGGCALGHPIGATGARILSTLLYALQQDGKQRGVASLCLGGGEAVALAVEMM